MLRMYVVPAASPSCTVQGIRTRWLLMVIPRSRSMSIRSRYWARIARGSTTSVSCSIRSASVDLPWSMCAMMQKLRRTAGSVLPGCGGRGFTAAGLEVVDIVVHHPPHHPGRVHLGHDLCAPAVCTGVDLG